MIKSTLKTLHSFGIKSGCALSPIADVALMGGAINFDGHRTAKWRVIFGESIAGDFYNVYSTNDYVLGLYSATVNGKASAGRNALPYEDEFKMLVKDKKVPFYRVNQTVKLSNRNVTYLCYMNDKGDIKCFESGHTNYRGPMMG